MPEHGTTSVSFLDIDAWRQLTGASSLDEYCNHWLALQCLMIRDVQSAIVLLQNPQQDGAFEPMAYWPEQGAQVSEDLKDAAEKTLDKLQGCVLQGEKGNSSIGYPVWNDGEIKALVVMELLPRPIDELRAVLRALQWGASWLDNFFLRQKTDQSAVQKDFSQLQQLIEMFAHVLEQHDFEHACMMLVNELANQFSCDRVSLGLKKRGKTVVQSMSHSTQMNKKMNLVSDIAEAMDEAMDQQTMIHFPADKNHLIISLAHARLKESNDSSAVMTLPLRGQSGDVFAALMLEKAEAEERFAPEKVAYLQAFSALLGPVLDNMHKVDSPFLIKLGHSMKKQWARLVGEGYLFRKFFFVTVSLLIIYFIFATSDYRVTAKARLEGEVRRSIVVPFDGYIDKAYVRVGDEVKKDELLLKLDERDLNLERMKWISKRGEHSHRYHQAQAKHDLGESRLEQVQMEQAEAELELVNDKIKRTSIVAPFDGLIADGDLSQSLGSVVQRGDVLFEMTPLSAYRVILKVDESAITDIAYGQHGELYLTSMPDRIFSFKVKTITPLATAEDGINYFRVEASLDGADRALRPGMEGVAKVMIGERKHFWILTHDMFNWLRLRLWSLTGWKI